MRFVPKNLLLVAACCLPFIAPAAALGAQTASAQPSSGKANGKKKGKPVAKKNAKKKPNAKSTKKTKGKKKVGKKKVFLERHVVAVENKKKSDDFLAENKNKPGIVTLPSGLQYKVMSEGNGPMAHSNDTVTVNYKGTLIDGTEWDNTAQRGKPATFPLMGAPKFWGEAAQHMKVGSKWQLFVPPDLAYGTNGYRSIPANAVLIVEVELLTNAPPPSPPTAAPSAPLTSEIIKVPSLEDMKKGAKIETLSEDDVKREIEKQRELQRLQALTNGAPQLPK